MNSQTHPANKVPKPKKRSACPISGFLDILGDKWTLLVVRDLFIGLNKYKDFQNGPEGIPTNILAERLKRLECANIISKQQYQNNPVRYHYHLTDKGKKLSPVIKEIMNWGNEFLPGTLAAKDIKIVADKRLSASKQ